MMFCIQVQLWIGVLQTGVDQFVNNDINRDLGGGLGQGGYGNNGGFGSGGW